MLSTFSPELVDLAQRRLADLMAQDLKLRERVPDRAPRSALLTSLQLLPGMLAHVGTTDLEARWDQRVIKLSRAWSIAHGCELVQRHGVR